MSSTLYIYIDIWRMHMYNRVCTSYIYTYTRASIWIKSLYGCMYTWTYVCIHIYIHRFRINLHLEVGGFDFKPLLNPAAALRLMIHPGPNLYCLPSRTSRTLSLGCLCTWHQDVILPPSPTFGVKLTCFLKPLKHGNTCWWSFNFCLITNIGQHILAVACMNRLIKSRMLANWPICWPYRYSPGRPCEWWSWRLASPGEVPRPLVWQPHNKINKLDVRKLHFLVIFPLIFIYIYIYLCVYIYIFSPSIYICRKGQRISSFSSVPWLTKMENSRLVDDFPWDLCVFHIYNGLPQTYSHRGIEKCTFQKRSKEKRIGGIMMIADQ